MLPPFIIEQIRRREEEERLDEKRPRLELPLPQPGYPAEQQPADEEPERGVVIIDLLG